MVVLFYAIWVGVVADRISRMIHVTMIRVPRPPAGDSRIFGIPLQLIVVLTLTFIGTFIAAEIAVRMRRRRRQRLDQCVECGSPIRSWRGRCPGCGVRVGPDPRGRVTLDITNDRKSNARLNHARGGSAS
jgi:hypothetical protein